MGRHLLPVALLSLAACTPEQEFHEIPIDAIAVSSGDYDRMEALLLRQLVNYQLYEGYIVGATYEPEIEPDDIILEVEGLFASDDELDNFGAVFVNSGTRGLGAWVYNGVDPDDALVTDPAVIDNVKSFVSRGGALVVSDWAYDLVEACWPDAITFVGDEAVLDDAQRGARGSVQAMVHDLALVDALGQNVVSVSYDFSHWAVMASVGSEVEVILSGDVRYRASESDGEAELEDVPLLVAFPHGAGTVYFSTFHWHAQSSAVADTILFSVVDGLYPGGGEEADTGAGPQDTGV
jgi:hypothetical protein